jgi:hypothetical protein
MWEEQDQVGAAGSDGSSRNKWELQDQVGATGSDGSSRIKWELQDQMKAAEPGWSRVRWEW